LLGEDTALGSSTRSTRQQPARMAQEAGMKEGPWTSGPRELLQHAKDHVSKETDVDNRFAMISVDNAVELMLKTYLRLPKSVTGLALTRKQRNEHTKDFPSAVAAIRRLIPTRVSAVPLDEVEWFHQIRNQLYHEGNAITVERDKVKLYLEHAELLMRCLFGGEFGRPQYYGGLFDLATKGEPPGKQQGAS
jgi:hypothetical protein